VFEMTDRGLLAVEQPSASAMAGRPGAVGSAVMAAMEGSRPMMVEVQALVAPSYASAPRRLATGVDTGRLLQVLAVLERHAKIVFGQHDVYVALSGGIRVVEPAADLALAMALTSARVALPVPAEMVAFGEIGLTGEIRGVPHIEARLREAARLGFRTAVTGRGGADPRSAVPSGLELHRVFSLEEALKVPGLAG
jgi:DNA repair protein RadA/Sms